VHVLRIPDERVGVLIGEDGATLNEIEELTQTDLTVEDGEVEIDGDDPLDELRAVNIVKAIGRGFNPKKAFRLLEENAGIAIIDVTRFAGTDNSKKRLKGRVIGREGEAKQHIENTTDTELAIYGKTVSILGPVSHVEVAKKAVEMLLEGRSHATAWRYIEQNQAKLLGR